MKKYFCDVCGAELPGWDNATMLEPSHAVRVCDLTELCPRCIIVARNLNVKTLVLAELRRLAAEKDEKAEPAPQSAPIRSPMGKAAKEKREILAAVEAYRKEHGPGAILKLAQLANVSESELRDMISCNPVPITIWRRVGKALGVEKEEAVS